MIDNILKEVRFNLTQFEQHTCMIDIFLIKIIVLFLNKHRYDVKVQCTSYKVVPV